jgi:hypothetical protein
VAGIHRTEVKQLDNGTSLCELRGIIRRRGELLQNLPADTGRGLLPLHQRAIAKVAFHKEHHLVVPHQNLVAADVVEPSLHQSLDAILVLLGTGASRRDRGRNSGN